MEKRRKYGPYKPKLRYDDQIKVRTHGQVAGYCYRTEKEMLDRVAKIYKSDIHRKRRVIRKRRLLYQVMLVNDLTIEIAYLEVGVKGYYVRYCKVKEMKWRYKKLGRRL